MRGQGGRLRWKTLHGMPFGGYTAALSESAQLLEATVAAQVLENLLLEGDEVLLNLWPIANLRLREAHVQNLEEVSAIDISGGVDQALSRIGSKSRRMAGQARRRGVSCAIETGPTAVDIYYDLLQEASRERWHLPEPRLSRELVHEVCSSDRSSVELWIARFDGAPIAGGIALYGGEEVLLWTTAMRSGVGALRPHNILHTDIIGHAAARGIHWYNLASSANLSGVLKFKRELGATPFFYQIAARQSPPLRAVSVIKRMLGSRLGL